MRWDDLRLCVPSDLLPADNAAMDALLGRFVVSIPKQHGICMAVQGNAHVQLETLHQVASVLLKQLVTYMTADASVISQLLGLTPQQLVKWQQHLQRMCTAGRAHGADQTEASPNASCDMDSGVAKVAGPGVGLEAPLGSMLAGLPMCELAGQGQITDAWQHNDGMQRRDDSRPDLVSFLIKDEEQTDQAAQAAGGGSEVTAAHPTSEGQPEPMEEGAEDAEQPAAQHLGSGTQLACPPVQCPDTEDAVAVSACAVLEVHSPSAPASPGAQHSSEQERTTSPPDLEMQSNTGVLQGIQLLAQAAVELESATAAACVAAGAAGPGKRKRRQTNLSDGQGATGGGTAAQDHLRANHQPAAKRHAGLKMANVPKMHTSAMLQLVGLLPPQCGAAATDAGPSDAGPPTSAMDIAQQAGVAGQPAAQRAPPASQPAGRGLVARSRAPPCTATPQPSMVQMSVGWVTIPFQLDPEVLVHVLAPSGSRVVTQSDGRQVVELPSNRQVQLPWATAQPQQPGQAPTGPTINADLPAGTSLAVGAQPTQKPGGRRHARRSLVTAAATPAVPLERPAQPVVVSQEPAAPLTGAAHHITGDTTATVLSSPVLATALVEPPAGTVASPVRPSTEDVKLSAEQPPAHQTLHHPSTLASPHERPAEQALESAADAAGVSPGTEVAALSTHDLGCRLTKSREMAEYILLVARQAGAGGFQLFDMRQAAALDNRDYHKRDMGNLLKQLVEKGRLLRVGRGGAGDPFRYFDPEAVVPAPTSGAQLGPASSAEAGQDASNVHLQQLQVD